MEFTKEDENKLGQILKELNEMKEVLKGGEGSGVKGHKTPQERTSSKNSFSFIGSKLGPIEQHMANEERRKQREFEHINESRKKVGLKPYKNRQEMVSNWK